MNITFIGNCQPLSLCFYFQELLPDCDIQWLLYGDEFKKHLDRWTDKVKNKVLDYDIALDVIKTSDVIVYQEITKEKSQFSNTETLESNKKESCRLIKMPSIFLDYANYDESIKELNRREVEKQVDIMVSRIFEKYRDQCRMLSVWHPNTFLFLEVVNELCKLLNIDTFSEIQRDIFLQDNNYIKLP